MSEIKLLTRRIEQLILLNCRTLGINPSLSNKDVHSFAVELMTEIERAHFDEREPSINPLGFPESFYPKEKKEFKDFNIFTFLYSFFGSRLCKFLNKTKG